MHSRWILLMLTSAYVIYIGQSTAADDCSMRYVNNTAAINDCMPQMQLVAWNGTEWYSMVTRTI